MTWKPTCCTCVGRRRPRFQSLVRNPIFLLLNFLQQDNDDCHDCDLTLPQVSARDRWETLTATGRALRDGSTQYEITNRLAPPRAYVLKTRQTSSGETPVELTRFYPNGRVAFHITTTGGIRRRARSEEGAPQLNVQVFDEDAGTLALSGSWVIDTLRINEPVGGTAFELDAEHARSVWDSDLNMFIKHPDDRSLGRVLSPPH
jgi:hypothetical protein